MEWKPIETAPTDGTFILLCGGKTDEDEDYYAGVEINRPVTARYYKDEWVFGHWDGHWASHYNNPTHWMPLPALLNNNRK